MTREILFRGKCVDNGEWVYGVPAFCKKDGQVFMLKTVGCESHLIYHAKVIPETVGQFTGLTDKNGQKIFEDDILKYIPRLNCDIYYKVAWQQEYSRFSLVQWSTHKYQLYEWAEDEKIKYMCEVIGNVHDNSGLLESLEGGAQ